MKRLLVVCTTDSMIWNFLRPHIDYLQSNGYHVDCACSRTGFYFDELQAQGYSLIEVPFERNPFKKKNIHAYKKLSSIIDDGDYFFIQGHEPVGGALARIAGKVNKKYVMYFCHGFHFFSKAPIRHWLLYFFFEWFLSFFTDSIITICKEDYSHLRLLHAKRNYIIPGIGVDFGRFIRNEKNEECLKKTLGLSNDCFTILSVGELSKRKNHTIILDALSKIDNSSIHLLLCGDGELKAYLMEKASCLHIEKQVHFIGFQRNISNYYYISDLFIFPSLWEGLGLAGIEAMYCGLPVIGSDRQGIKDYVINGKTGFRFDPKDSNALARHILYFYHNRSIKEEMRESLKNYSLFYSIDNSIKELEKIYHKESLL